MYALYKLRQRELEFLKIQVSSSSPIYCSTVPPAWLPSSRHRPDSLFSGGGGGGEGAPGRLQPG